MTNPLFNGSVVRIATEEPELWKEWLIEKSQQHKHAAPPAGSTPPQSQG